MLKRILSMLLPQAVTAVAAACLWQIHPYLAGGFAFFLLAMQALVMGFGSRQIAVEHTRYHGTLNRIWKRMQTPELEWDTDTLLRWVKFEVARALAGDAASEEVRNG